MNPEDTIGFDAFRRPVTVGRDGRARIPELDPFIPGGVLPRLPNIKADGTMDVFTSGRFKIPQIDGPLVVPRIVPEYTWSGPDSFQIGSGSTSWGDPSSDPIGDIQKAARAIRDARDAKTIAKMYDDMTPEQARKLLEEPILAPEPVIDSRLQRRAFARVVRRRD